MDYTVMVGLVSVISAVTLVALWVYDSAMTAKYRKACISDENDAALDEYDELYNELRQACNTRDELMKELIVGYVDLKIKDKG